MSSSSPDLADAALAWIVRLHSGEAQEAERRGYRDWCALSAEHAAAAQEAEALWDLLGHVHRDPASGRIEPGRARARISRRQVLGGLAVAGTLGLGAPWLRDQALRLGADAATGVAEIRDLTLPDHTQVALNAQSLFDTEFAEGSRQVRLRRGQGWFGLTEAGKDFLIRAGDLRVQLSSVGGVDVNLNMPEGQVAVSVRDTSARLLHPQRPDALELPAGGRAVLGADGRLLDEAPGGATNASAWRDGLLIAEDTPLSEIVAGLRPWSRGWIVVTDEDAARALRVNAVLDLKDPGGALRAMAQGLPIRLYRAGPLMTVISVT
ncbi:DUF4880 domain-containing protein [Pseudooceanicola sp. GBMRC 2024]|uniref:DUF4880 domain-containing protein n=1 Tax=Pseudooceanicola albus TaxID=2692189 RepID=A0A6L7G1M7_9RHOB|nr:DUF4880 domain-containing protein [Pseudooceanicola albus]MXN17965.1 DUF4880 domain-containing protein [Pseudooceanicola albus]